MPIGHLLNTTVTHTRPLKTPDGAGGFGSVPTTLGTLKIRRFAASSSDRELGAQLAAIVTDAAYVLPAANVQRDDVLVDGATDLRVLVVLDPSRPDFRKVLLQSSQRGQ